MKKTDTSPINEKKFKRIWITLVILVMLIAFGVSYASLGKIDVLLPTGNIDIFDINISGEKCEECEICPTCKCETTKPVGGQIEDPPKDDPEEEIDDGKLSVLDKTDLLENQAELKIFENPAFEYVKNMIAPGVSNTYQFIVRNNNEFGIIYDINMEETNPENINMKYKLKRNGEYVVGDENTWATAEELVLTEEVLATKTKSVYSLEWKWIDTEEDTQIGENAEELYKLKISFDAEEYNL